MDPKMEHNQLYRRKKRNWDITWNNFILVRFYIAFILKPILNTVKHGGSKMCFCWVCLRLDR